jgi:hypothetical protein
MMRRLSTFKKTDVTRATRAVLAAGLEIARVKVAKDGSIAVIAGNRSETNVDQTKVEANEWDEIDGTPPAAIRTRVS